MVGDEREVEIHNLRLDRLAPQDEVQAYNYQGSLTTPPCSEGVNWFVVSEVDSMSSRQLREIRDLFSGEEFPSGNARPIQRTIVDDLISLPIEND